MRLPLITLFSFLPFAVCANGQTTPATPNEYQPFTLALTCAPGAFVSGFIQQSTSPQQVESIQGTCPASGVLTDAVPGLPTGGYLANVQYYDPQSMRNVGYTLSFSVTGNTTIVPFSFYQITPQTKSFGVAADLCMEAAGSGTANGTVIDQNTCVANRKGQQWTLTPTDSGYYFISNGDLQVDPQNPIYEYPIDLDVQYKGTANGSLVHIWQNLYLPNQQWMPVPLADGNYTFVGRGSQRCLDVPDASTGAGVQLQIFDCNGTSAQEFGLVPVQ